MKWSEGIWLFLGSFFQVGFSQNTTSSVTSPPGQVLVGWLITISVGPNGYCDGVNVFCNGNSFCSASICCCPVGSVNNGTFCIPATTQVGSVPSQPTAVPTQLPTLTTILTTTKSSPPATTPLLETLATGPLLTYPTEVAVVTVPTTTVSPRPLVQTIPTVPVGLPLIPIITRPPVIGDFCAITPQCPTGAFCIRGVCLCATGTVQVGNSCSPVAV